MNGRKTNVADSRHLVAHRVQTVSRRMLCGICGSLLTVLLMTAAVSTACAQDTDTKNLLLVVGRDAEFQSSGETVDVSHHGAVVAFTRENGNWKWVPDKKGWIHDRDTVAFDTAVETFSDQLRGSPRNAEAYINRAAAWRALGKRQEAISDLDEAIRLNDNDSLAFTLRGICHSETGNIDAAITDLERAVQLDSKYVRPRMVLAITLRSKGEQAAAVEQLSEVLRLDTANHAAYLQRAQAWAARGELDIAMSDFNEAIRLRPASGEAYRLRAALWRAQQNAQKELSDLNEALRIDAKDSIALYWRGNMRIHQGDLDSAIADLTQVVTIDPDAAPAFNLRAIARERKNEIADALSDYGAAIQLQPQNTLYLMNRADTLQKAGELQKAWNDITSVLNLYKESGDASPQAQAAAWVARSGVLRQARQDDDALNDLNEAIRVHPESADAFNRRGLIYEARKDYAAALKDYQESSRLDPSAAFPWCNQGDVHRVQGRNQEAYNAYTKAIELNPRYAVAYNNRGLIWESLQKYEEALKDYSAALEINPNFVQALRNRGDVWRATLEPQKAVTDYTAALAIDATAALIYVGRARAYHVLGDQDSLQKGLDDCSKAISLDDKYDTAYALRGLIRRELGSDRDSAARAAIEDFTAAIAVNPRYLGAYNERGATRSLLGDFSAAIADFNESLSIDAENIFALTARGAAWRKIGQLDKATLDLDTALTIEEGHLPARLERGQVRVDLGEYEAAAADYRQVIEADPNNAGAHNLLARLLSTAPDDELRDGSQALAMATRALELAGESNSEYLATLAAVHAELGDFDKAIQIHTQLAATSAADETELEFYRSRRPYRIGGEVPIEIEPYPEVDAVTPVANAMRTDFIPAEAFASIVIRPSEILADTLISQFPVDVFAAEILGDVPIAPANLEEVVVVMFPHKRLPPGFILRLHEAVNEVPDHQIGDLDETSLTALQVNGRSCQTDGYSAVCRIDPTTYIVGPNSAVTRMLAADQTPSVLRNLLHQTAADAPLFASVALRACPRFLTSIAEEAIPQTRQAMALLPDGSELTLRLTLDPVPRLKADVVMQDAESAARLNLEVIRGVGLVKELANTMHKRFSILLPAPLGNELQEMVRMILESAAPVMSEKTVSLSVAAPESLPEWLEKASPMIAAAIGASRAAAQESRSTNNLKQIALGFQLSHDTHGHFPARAITDDAGKPLLSWRVHLLPYLEHQKLYEQFHLNEPWDSDHNRALIDQMPNVFQGTQHRSDGRTTFIVPVGPGTIFETANGLQFAEIPDGASNTVLVLDAGEEHAVEWTRPDSINFDPNRPASLFGEDGEGVAVGFADSSIRIIPANTADDTVRAIMSRNGGEAFVLE